MDQEQPPDSPTQDLRTKWLLDFVFAHAKQDTRPYLKVDIYGVTVLALLDSGCSKTVIGKKGWDWLSNTTKLTLAANRSCTIANGDECQVIGTVTLPICLRDRVKIFDVLVVPTLPHFLILGVDFWTKMEIIPDLFSDEWSFREQSLPDQVTAIHDMEHLNPEQRNLLESLITDTFQNMSAKLGCTSAVSHIIRTSATPIKQRHYPLSPPLQKHVNEELDRMLKDGIIEPSSSPWASPIVLVKKPDNTYRFCVNYKRLNEVSLPDAYPLPFVSSILDKLRDARYLTTLDIKSAYWQIPMAEESKPLTAFVVPTRGLFQFRRMPFGLHNAPATWQRFIDQVVGVDLEEFCFVYLDDIVICTPTFEQHIDVLKKVLHRLVTAGLTLNQDKCFFCKSELKYLGYVVNAAGLMVDADKVDAIVNLPPPRNITEVRRVVGLASWYRRFVPNFSTLTAPLTALLKKNVSFKWDDNCQTSFESIKTHLISAPVLSCPNFEVPFSLQTDASDYGLGAVLSQQHEDGEKVICYLSRSLTKAERKYTTTEKECLAVLFAIERCRPWIEGSKFTVVTDHYSLKWLFNIKDPVGRIARWALRLQQYDFEVIHRKGKDHVVADALSRAVPPIDCVAAPDPTNGQQDKWLQTMLTRVQQDPDKFPLWRVEGIDLYKRANLRFPDLTQCQQEWLKVVPKGQRNVVIKNHHDPPLSGHLGIFKTLNRISSSFYWPKMKYDVARYVNRCTVCLQNKPEQRKTAGQLLTKTTSVTRPFQLLSVDIMGPLPRSSSGNCYILAVCDCFSKFCLLFPMRSATTPPIIKLLEERVILVFGAPTRVITDNGVQFKSNAFQSLMKEYQIKQVFTANYHPQSNPVERVNRVVKTMLRCYVGGNHRTWDKNLSKIGWAIRSARHEVTGLTPNFIVYGREIPISGNEGIPLNDVLDFDRSEELISRSKALEEVYKDVSCKLKKAYERSSKTYNLRHRPDTFTLNQDVWKRHFSLSDASKHFTSKLAPKYVGPYKICRILSPWSYELRDTDGRSIGIWHAKDLKAHPPDLEDIDPDRDEPEGQNED